MPKTASQKARRAIAKAASTSAKREEIANSMAFNPSALHGSTNTITPSTLLPIHNYPTYYTVHKHDTTAIRTQPRVIEHNDVLLEGFKFFQSSKSQVVYFIDGDDNNNVVLMVKISLFENMKNDTRAMFQSMLDYLHKDSYLKYTQGTNHALLSGQMKRVGWRGAMEKGAKFGQYALNTVGRKARENDETATLKHLVEDTLVSHRLMAKNFDAVCPMIFQERKAQHLASNLPIAGQTAQMTQADIDNKLHDTLWANPDPDLYSAHFIYTYGGFYNEPHCDLDANTWTNAIWFPCTKRGEQGCKLASIESDGFKQEGYGFAMLDWGIVIDLANISGVVEVVFRGKQDIHCTTIGTIAEGFERMACTSQVNKDLEGICTGIWKRKGTTLMDYAEREKQRHADK